MSYRAFKRLLGETSLERKSLLLLGTVSLLLITSSFLVYAKLTERIAYNATASSGRLLIPSIVLSKHEQDTDSREAMQEFQDRAEKKSKTFENYGYTIIKPSARKPVAPNADPEEVRMINRFLNDPGHPEESRQSGDNFLYYGAIRATPKCLTCHPRPDEKETMGDLKDDQLMYVVRISLSSNAIEENVNLNRAILISVALVTVLSIMAGSYLIVRYVIVKPVKHLKEVSDAIAAGELNVRSEIQTGDEFEDLSYAFNRMLRSLMATQEQLRETNIALDRRLDELARANMALYESNRLKSDFLATMSHELRTPLNSILGFSELMLANPQLGDRLRRWAGNVQSSGKQLLALINDLLDLAKIEAGKMEIKPEVVSVADLAEGLLAMFRPLAEKKNIDLRSAIDPALPPVVQDVGKLRQILSNLLSNALKFTPEGERVLLRAESDGPDLILAVSDTGIGIATADQDVIFDKFRQAASPMTREYEGTGLGLSIVRELSKLLGGDVSLKSELGRGSTFTVRIPLVLKDAPRIAFEPQRLADGPDGVPQAAATA
jgi:signal transduction histidine kinase